MNSFERVHSAVKFQKTDCIPVGPYMGNFGATIAGIPIDKYCQSGSMMAKGQFDACQIIDQDIMVLQSDNYYIAEGFGLQVEHHPGEIPTSVGPLLEEIHDCHKLNIPDPRKDGRMPNRCEIVKAVKNHGTGADKSTIDGRSCQRLILVVPPPTSYIRHPKSMEVTVAQSSGNSVRNGIVLVTYSLVVNTGVLEPLFGI